MKTQRTAFLVYFLGFVMVLFIGILVYVWMETKKAHPVMLDEKGRVLGQVHGSAGPLA